MTALVADARQETVALRELLEGLEDGTGGWDRPTPAAGWSVRDQVTHLAFFDDAAVLSANDRDRFTSELVPALRAGQTTPDTIAADHRAMAPGDVLDWFDRARSGLLTTFEALDPSLRVPWFGPPMSAASSLTARIMETWAHGQDVADALARTRTPTERLRHVVHIGVGARAFSYLAHGREVSTTPVRVELVAPDGATWAWGPEDATDRVTGPALDFALLVTQRRHRVDTALSAEGDAADGWLSIAQAFAGPPGPGRAPGQFAGGEAGA